MSRSATQAKVAAHKRAHPELYCPITNCLWRTTTPRGPSPCRHHPVSSKLAIDLAAMRRAADPERPTAPCVCLESDARACAKRRTGSLWSSCLCLCHGAQLATRGTYLVAED